MVELHYRDQVTGEVIRAIYETQEEASAQASADTSQGLGRVPFLIVAHNPEVEFNPAELGYNPLALVQLEVLDPSVLDLATS